MAVDAKMIKALRDKTGYPITAVKKALLETDGDAEAATMLLRKKMGDKAGSKSDRTTGEGVISALSGEGFLVLMAIGCEQEPTTKNEHFLKFVAVAETAAKTSGATSVDELLEVSVDGTPLKEMLRDLAGLLGENIKITSIARLDQPADGVLGQYVHFNKKAGAICALKLSAADAANAALLAAANDVCMHTVAARPVALNRDDVPTDLVEKEKEVFRDEVESKPENIREKIMAGKLGKFYKATCLTEQVFVKDPDGKLIVRDMVAAAGKAAGGTAEICGYARLELG